MRKLLTAALIASTALATIPALARTHGSQHRHFDLYNMTGSSIKEVSLAPSGPGGQPRDMTGPKAIRPHDARIIDAALVSDGCTVDLRVMYDNGATQSLDGIDACYVQRIDARVHGLKVVI